MFISTSYDDIMHYGKFNKNWVLKSSFENLIFKELVYVRVISRDGINLKYTWDTAGIFLLATLNDHVIMAEFVRIYIKDYLRISSEMVNFVCYS